MIAMVSWETAQQLAASGIVVGCVYALVALGFNVIYNATGLLNFAHGEFLLLGGLMLYTCTSGLGLALIPAVVLSVATVGAVGGLIELVVVRNTRGRGLVGAGTALLGVSLLLIALQTALWGPDPISVRPFTSGAPVRIAQFSLTPQQLWVVGVTVVTVVLLQQFFARSRLGLAMRAASLNGGAARGVGISTERMSFLAFVVGSALAGLGGILITPAIGVTVGGGLNYVLMGFTAALLGGIGDARGAVIGGLALGLVESLSVAFIASGYQPIVPMTLLILVFMVRPGGLLGVGLASRA